MHRSIPLSWLRKITVVLLVCAMAAPASAQESLQEAIQSLQTQNRELQSLLQELRAEMVRVRTETTALRQDLESTRRQLAGELQTPEGPSIERLEEEQQLLSAKVQEQYQTKVESTSKYRMRLSGAVLMNLFTNRGAVNDIDFPSIAVQYSPLGHRGSTGASVRQSLIGFEVFGPQIKGAQVSADVQFDFAGGFPETPDGVALGLPRLRTGVVHLVWPRTSVIAGQDLPFISPLSPSSVASLAVPAFSYSGNLWTWTPQIRVERRVAVTDNSGILLQGGILDPLTGELPDSEYYRMPQAGEASRQPAYASRIAWDRRSAGGPLAIGIGGYYSRQDWAFHRNVDAWAVTSDWIVPMPGRLEFSGEMYRGRAVGGLGGGIGRSTIFSGPITDTATQVRGLNSTGGWAQLKFRQTERLEWNGALGLDNIHAADLRVFPVLGENDTHSPIARNRGSFLNLIYRPRSDVLLSVEYRRLKTFPLGRESESADHINLSIGVLF